jgi:hypothetical protein
MTGLIFSLRPNQNGIGRPYVKKVPPEHYCRAVGQSPRWPTAGNQREHAGIATERFRGLEHIELGAATLRVAPYRFLFQVFAREYLVR